MDELKAEVCCLSSNAACLSDKVERRKVLLFDAIIAC